LETEGWPKATAMNTSPQWLFDFGFGFKFNFEFHFDSYDVIKFYMRFYVDSWQRSSTGVPI
jgi:hypothetical protein